MNRRELLAQIAEELASKPLIGNEHKYGPDLVPILRYFPRDNANIGFDWCAAFVYHCCTEAGVRLPVRYPEPVSRNFAWVEAWLEWGQLHGFYHHVSDSSFIPDQGDLVIFDNILGNGPNDHIGVVLRIEQDKIITAEGNFYNKSGVFQRERERINGYIRIDDTY
ncbi:CHAP domain-containing protein [Paenibacillus sp. D2_2]|uniref:CHAP domain-containing protein n=1 Tax=Paenibacillus sp. D2_2 TaxID=3073092 RepID=UPI002815B41C|nr:CHAP domain-containing protein [Paenibacillus sp. D2_2]WMT39604.1 CHAP domain-containing protein [Paenibacillus sp. D2_2]